MRIKKPNCRPPLCRRVCRQALAVTMVATIGVFAGGVARASEPAPFFNGFETDLTGWFTTGSPLAIAASGTGGIASASGVSHAQPTSGQYTRYGASSVTNEFPADGYSVRLDVYLDLAGGYANDTRFDWSSAFNKNNGTTFGRDFIFNGGFYNDAVAPGSGPRFVISASNNAPGWPKNPGNDPFVVSSSGWYTFKHRFRDNGSGILAVDLIILDSSGNALKTWTLSNPADLAGPADVDPRYGWIVTNQSAPGIQAAVAGTGVIAAFDNTRLRFNQPVLTVNASSPAAVGSTQTLTTSGGAGTGTVTYSVGASTSCSVVGDQLTMDSPGTCSVTATKAGDDDYEPGDPSASVEIATITNLVVNPITPVYSANNVTGVQADSAPGFGTGSLASNGVAKTDLYLTPAMLFGGPITLGDIASIRYWTKKGTTHAVDPGDWYLLIYTNPFPGDVSTPTWYGDRIGTEPYFSASISDPANTWNQWASDGSSSKLRFFQSTAGAPGATLGSYSDPHWDTFVTGNSTGTAIPLAGHTVLYFSPQTGNPWAAGFTGQLDGLRIELTNGSIANVNFEFQCVADAECDSNGECTIDTCNVGDGTCSTAFLPSSTECRASAGDCDVAESCTGSDVNCPADGFEASSVECRASAGDCDLAENCTGGDADCPADGFVAGGTPCRASAGVCDVAEACTGSAALCPANGFVAGGTPCSDGSECTTGDTCSGGGAACVGGPAPDCDDTNVCTDDSCNPSTLGGCEHVDNTDPCDDGLYCTIGDVCSGGTCSGPDARDCSADGSAGDFESPACVLGSINGQDGWMKTGPFDHAVSSSGGAAGFGAQSLRISNAVTSGSFGDQTFSSPVANEVGESDALSNGMSGGSRRTIFETRFDIVSAVPAAQQPGLFFSTNADRGDGSRMTYLGFSDTAAGINVLFYDYQDVAPYGSVGDEATGCGAGDNFFLTTVATALDRSVPHTIREVLEVVDGPRNDVVTVYIDDVLVHTGTSWEDYFRWCAESGAGGVSRTVDSRLFRTGGGAAPGTSGLGFLIDNFSLTSGTTEGSACGATCNEAADNCLAASGTVCRAGSGDMCDPAETCTGVDADCPADVITASGTHCRVGSGDMCDPTETCTGVATEACPMDVVEPDATVCNAGSGDLCDVDEFCTGTAGEPCPADVVEVSGAVCRTGSGDMCDPTEVCTGVADAACPADVVLPDSTVCDAGSGDLCDVDQFCTGTAGQTCPADVVAPPGTVCRAGSGDMCDPTEVCTGVAEAACPADVLLPDTTVCRAGSGDMCNPTEYCTGSPTAACPADSYLPSSAVCRTDTGDCDVAENCPGTPAACPADAFEPSETLCTNDGDECTRDRCNGANSCLHPPIKLAEACNWLITGGTDTREVKARTRLGTVTVGDICADKGEVGQSSVTADDSSWVLLGLGVTTLKVRPFAEIGTGDVVTAGGCLKGQKETEVFETGLDAICCGHGEVTLAGGGIVNACGTDPRIDECVTAKAQVMPDVAFLDGLSATRDLGRLDCSSSAPCEIDADGALSVIDIERLQLANDGVVTIDAMGDPDAVIVLRIQRGVKSLLRGRFELTGGAQPQNVLFYAAGGNCDLGTETTGGGTLFCPAGTVRLRVHSEWDGALVGGRNVDLGENAVLVHVPFTGLAD